MAYQSSRFVSGSLGFTMGILCCYFFFGIPIAYEIIASALVIEYWPNAVPAAAWITIILVVIISLNLSSVESTPKQNYGWRLSSYHGCWTFDLISRALPLHTMSLVPVTRNTVQ